MLGPKQLWIPNIFGSKNIWITKIGSKKVLDTEAYWVQINVRSKNLLSPKFCRAQKNISLKKYWEKMNFQIFVGRLKCSIQKMLCQKKIWVQIMGQKMIIISTHLYFFRYPIFWVCGGLKIQNLFFNRFSRHCRQFWPTLIFLILTTKKCWIQKMLCQKNQVPTKSLNSREILEDCCKSLLFYWINCPIYRYFWRNENKCPADSQEVKS